MARRAISSGAGVRHPGGLLVVTHDRWFLDEVCTKTWEVHNRVAAPFDGGYAAYVLQRAERARQSAGEGGAPPEPRCVRSSRGSAAGRPPHRQAEVPHRRGRASSRTSRDPRQPAPAVRSPSPRLGKDVVDLLDASVAYDGNRVLRTSSGGSPRASAPASSASTARASPPSSACSPGRCSPRRARSAGQDRQVATLSQRIAELEDHLTSRSGAPRWPRTTTTRTGSKTQELTPAQLLERFGFANAQLSTPVRDLSGGSSAASSCC